MARMRSLCGGSGVHLSSDRSRSLVLRLLMAHGRAYGRSIDPGVQMVVELAKSLRPILRAINVARQRLCSVESAGNVAATAEWRMSKQATVPRIDRRADEH